MFWLRALVFAAALTLGTAGAGAMGGDRDLPVSTAAPETEEFPVRWSPSLGLKTLDDVERRLREPLWGDEGILLARRWRYVGNGQPPEPIEPHRIISCSDYWAVDLTRLNTRSQSDHNLLREFAATCTALKALGAVKPAKQNFVSDFRLDEPAVDILPAGTHLPISPVEQREIEDANAQGWSWRQWHESRESSLVAAHEAADGSATFAWTRSQSRMEILAWGDFNGDGVADLLLRISEWPGYAHASRSKTFLVTRHAPHGVMQALPWPWETTAESSE